MTTTIDIRELPERFRELVALADAGVEVVVTEDGKPRATIAAIIPAHILTTRIAGLHPGAMTASDDFDEPLPDEFWMGET